MQLVVHKGHDFNIIVFRFLWHFSKFRKMYRSLPRKPSRSICPTNVNSFNSLKCFSFETRWIEQKNSTKIQRCINKCSIRATTPLRCLTIYQNFCNSFQSTNACLVAQCRACVAVSEWNKCDPRMQFITMASHVVETFCAFSFCHSANNILPNWCW